MMTWQMRIQEEREDAWEEGYKKGYKIGIILSMASLVQDGLIDLTTAANQLNMTIEEFQTAAGV